MVLIVTVLCGECVWCILLFLQWYIFAIADAIFACVLYLFCRVMLGNELKSRAHHANHSCGRHGVHKGCVATARAAGSVFVECLHLVEDECDTAWKYWPSLKWCRSTKWNFSDRNVGRSRSWLKSTCMQWMRRMIFQICCATCCSLCNYKCNEKMSLAMHTVICFFLINLFCLLRCFA